MSKIYDVEIVGLVSIEADSPTDAVAKVLEMFETDELSYNDLSFECDDDEREEHSFKKYADEK